MATFKVLLVDDDNSYYILIEKMLAREGDIYRVDWVASLAEARQAISGENYDVFLVDYRLGNESGLELVQELISRGIFAPLILMTGYNEANLDIKVLQVGVADYLDKSDLKPSTLNRTIRYAVQRAQDSNALRASEENYRLLLEDASDTIVITDAEGIIEIANSKASEVLRQSSDTLVGQALTDYMDLEHCIRKRLSEITAGETFLCEYTLKRSDGSTLPIEISIKRLNNGKLQCIARDITHRKTAELERDRYIQRLQILQEIEDELSQIVNIQNVLSLALDAAVRLSSADTGYIGLLEEEAFKIALAIGRYTEIVPGQTLPLSTIQPTVIQQQTPLLLLDVSSNPHYVATNPQTRAQMLIPLVSYDRLLGILTLESFRDDRFSQDNFDFIKLIAGRVAIAVENAQLYKVSQEQLARLTELFAQVSDLEKLKTDMIRIAAHDLRNPVGVIVGYLELLEWSLGDQITDRQKTHIDAMMRAAYRMEKITTDILSLERIEKMHLEKAQLMELNPLVADIYHELETQAQEKQQQYELHAVGDTLRVRVDSAQLREAAVNLVSNAIKYTPNEGTIAVHLRQEPGWAVFEVIDTGYGIQEEQQVGLFQPFYRASTEETAHIEGTGLGLHLVKNIITRHKGQMIFYSVYGSGSTFGFRLPLESNGDTGKP